jgi:hypothetical protein
MDYIIEKLNSSSSFLNKLSADLEENSLNDDDKKLAEADLVSHIERLILVCQNLRGVKIDPEKARQIASLI